MTPTLCIVAVLWLAPTGHPPLIETPLIKTQEQEASAPSPATESTPAARLEALIERFNAARSEVFEAYAAAETDEERQAALADMPGEEYVPEFRALAEEAAGTDTAIKAWMWALRLIEGDPQQSWEIVELLLSDHMDSQALSELTGELRYGAYQHGEERVIEALRAIVDESPHEKVRAGGLFTLGAVLLESKAAENKTLGRDCFNAVIAEYGDMAYRGDSTYGAAAKGYLYELDNLQVGMVAPDFATTDENGVDWKLHDYLGKVVIVDFWGFW